MADKLGNPFLLATFVILKKNIPLFHTLCTQKKLTLVKATFKLLTKIKPVEIIVK